MLLEFIIQLSLLFQLDILWSRTLFGVIRCNSIELYGAMTTYISSGSDPSSFVRITVLILGKWITIQNKRQLSDRDLTLNLWNEGKMMWRTQLQNLFLFIKGDTKPDVAEHKPTFKWWRLEEACPVSSGNWPLQHFLHFPMQQLVLDKMGHRHDPWKQFL